MMYTYDTDGLVHYAKALEERNAELVAALEKIAGLDPEDRYYGRTPYDLAVVIAREALQQSTEKP